jgi:predicted transcriptional regulator
VSTEGDPIVLTAKAEQAERRPEIDAAIAEGVADIRAGRITPPFKGMKEFEAWLDTDEGTIFGKE